MNSSLDLGKLTSYDYLDPVTNTRITFQAFDNNQIGTVAENLDKPLMIKYLVGPNGQYVDRNLIQVKTGGKLDVNVGSTGTGWMNDKQNQVFIILKSGKNNTFTSSVFKAEANSTLNYNSKTVVNLGNAGNNQIASDKQEIGRYIGQYSGSFTSAIGAQSVNSIDELKAYNSALIQAVKDQRITAAQYQTELSKAYQAAQLVYADYTGYQNDPISDVIDRGRIAYILADGSGAQVNVAQDANIQAYGSNLALVRLENGAALNNEGTLGAFFSSNGGVYIVLANNSSVVNNGVIDGGTNAAMKDFVIPGDAAPIGDKAVSNGVVEAVRLYNNSTMTNNGVINLQARQGAVGNTAVGLYNSKLTNTGAINLSASPEPGALGVSASSVGVVVAGSSEFVNNGELYIGRMAQSFVGETVADIAVNNPGNRLTAMSDNGSTINNGSMTIGKLVQGATMAEIRGYNTRFTNNGIMNIDGAAATSAPLQNIGVWARLGSMSAVNATGGTINLNGINAIGMKADSKNDILNQYARVTNSGAINVNTGTDTRTGTANFGLWAEGDKASAINNGTINLRGDGAIGAHARDQAQLTLTGNANMTFSGGSNQTGYYIFGTGAKLVDGSTGTQTVSTKGSTLYRIDGGASFDGSASNAQVNASGENATGVLATSATDAARSSLNTGKMNLTVSGLNATGVRVEGSAQGALSADTTLTLTGSGSSAGIVDGKYTDIQGNQIQVGSAVLTSLANLTSGMTAADAIGFIARNGGTLNHQGSIDFTTAGSTGVLVDGGTLNNSSSIKVNGVAVDIQGADSKAVNTGTVEATDGTAAFRVGDGASLALTGAGVVKAGGSAHGILLDTGAAGLEVIDAHIDMSAGGSGNGIENTAEVSGIKLSNTQITVGDGAGVRTAASLARENSGTINVNGSGSGLLFQNAAGTTANGGVDMSDSRQLVINVNTASGKGIVTNVKGDVKSGASVNVNDAAGGPALQVGGTTGVVEQSGRLVSKSTTSPVVAADNGYLGTFINKGDIIANSAAQVALEITSGLSGVHFVNENGGNIVGQVNLASNNNHTVDLHQGSTATDVNSAGGNDTFNLVNIDDSDVSLFTSLNAGTGDDTLNLRNASLTLAQTGKTISGFEKVNIANGSTLTLDNLLLTLGDNGNDATGTGFNIDADSTLVLKQNADTLFNNKLQGAGTVAANAAGHSFDFTTNNASNTFTGTLALTDATFGLDGINTQALTAATLQAGTDSHVTVADGAQNVGGLRFDGGTVAFNTGTPGEMVARGTVQTEGDLDISGHGVVEINAGSVTNHPVLPPGTVSLLEQDEGDQGIKLAGSTGTVTGSGGNLELRDQNGNLITDALTSSVIQGADVVANATYGYRLTSGKNGDGLYTTYGLTELDLLTSGAKALILNAYGKSGNAADLSARITGTGDLAIDTGTGQTVSLSNADNDYTGKTDVRSGTLLMNNDNVLGKTSELALAANTAFDMNGHSQTVGVLNTAAASAVDLNGGALSLTHGGAVNGSLVGAGALNLEGGTLTINGSNTGLSATTTIAAGADAQLNSTTGLGIGGIVNSGLLALKGATGDLWNSLSSNGNGNVDVAEDSDVILRGDNSGFAGKFDVDNGSALTATRQESLGTAAVTNSGTLNLATNSSWQVSNSITGTGDVTKSGSGIVTLGAAAAQYTGSTAVNGGGLQLGEQNGAVTLASGQVDVASGAVLGGFGGTAGNINNAGSLILGDLNSPVRASAVATTFTVGNDLVNSGEVTVGRSGGTAGNLLQVKGDYTGNDGHLTFNTALGGDSSLTDIMVVEGNTSGSTKVSVNNAGGTGAKTLNGIKLIHVDGQSDGEFKKDGRIVAGAYDYNLVRGKGANSTNWYLTNILDGGGEGGGGGGGDELIKIYRPESGAYASNMAAGNTLFMNRLHDRLGETHYVDALSGEEKVTSMWLRNVGGHTRSTDSSGQLKTQANRYVMQLGGDVAQWSTDNANRYHLGVMAGYGNQQSNTQNHLTGQRAEGSISGYSVGVYGIWLQDNAEKIGAYVDSWAQYNWFDNTVKGDSLAAESYKSKGITASVESGYTWKIGQKNERESYYIQPKAQVTWMGVEADDIREQNGTRVTGTGSGSVQTRVGVRAFMKGHSIIDEVKQREFEPFIEANWIHNTEDFGSQLNGVTVTQKGTRNIGELKVGVEGQINPSLNLWGNIGQQMGDKGYSDSSAMVGVKLNF